MGQLNGFVARGRGLLLLAVLVGLSGCAVVHRGPATIVLTLTASPDCNTCGSAAASALKFRVFQVADVGAAQNMLNKGLPWSKQLDAAGPNVLVRVTEDFISPGGTKQLSTVKDPAATAIVIEGNFCKRTGDTWFAVHSLAKPGPLHVMMGATGLSITTGK